MTHRDAILDFLKLKNEAGANTDEIAEKLSIGRTYVSRLVNELERDGLVTKTESRPVQYRLSREGTPESVLNAIIGRNGSLSRAVQLATAAVVYPKLHMHTMIYGAPGTGKTYFAQTMFRLAIEKRCIPESSRLEVLSCAENHPREEDFAVLIEKAVKRALQNKSMLLADDIQCLSRTERSFLKKHLHNAADLFIVCTCNNPGREITTEFEDVTDVKIMLPDLEKRPLAERFELIGQQMSKEAQRTEKTLILSKELMQCLLLYECSRNISQLKADIKLGCANAYVREYNGSEPSIELYVGDFDAAVRRGFLNYRLRKEETEQITEGVSSFVFNPEAGTGGIGKKKKSSDQNVYSQLQQRAKELQSKGIKRDEINAILCVEMEDYFKHYRRRIDQTIGNRSELENTVGRKLVNLTEAFLEKAGNILRRDFSADILCGLCLHVSAVLNNKRKKLNLTESQLENFRKVHPKEYELGAGFINELGDTFRENFQTEEIVFTALFLCRLDDDPSDKTSVLYAVSGKNVAQSLASAVNAVLGMENTFAFEIRAGLNEQSIYKDLLSCIHEMPDGRIVVLYESAAVANLCNLIADEIHKDITTVRIDALNVGIEYARSAARGIDPASLKHTNAGTERKPVIITLCGTGEGGAKELQNYIYGHIGEKVCEIIPLAISDRNHLREEVVKIRREKDIRCVVGSFNPHLFDIPFVSVSSLLGAAQNSLEEKLLFPPRNNMEAVEDELFAHLTMQLCRVNVKKLRKLLGVFFEKAQQQIGSIGFDAKLGLIMHIACATERIMAGEATPPNPERETICRMHKTEFRTLRELLRPLERTFSVIYSDDEAVNILNIICQL